MEDLPVIATWVFLSYSFLMFSKCVLHLYSFLKFFVSLVSLVEASSADGRQTWPEEGQLGRTSAVCRTFTVAPRPQQPRLP